MQKPRYAVQILLNSFMPHERGHSKTVETLANDDCDMQYVSNI